VELFHAPNPDSSSMLKVVSNEGKQVEQGINPLFSGYCSLICPPDYCLAICRGGRLSKPDDGADFDPVTGRDQGANKQRREHLIGVRLFVFKSAGNHFQRHCAPGSYDAFFNVDNFDILSYAGNPD